MDRNEERDDTVLNDLGAVIEETKGGVAGFLDVASTLRIQMGLTDD